jgi:deazaflavin-dependent oxidoreductase (nitroreductase family)
LTRWSFTPTVSVSSHSEAVSHETDLQVYDVADDFRLSPHQRCCDGVDGAASGASLDHDRAQKRLAAHDSTWFFEDNGAYIISASNAGGAKNPNWFGNLQANPNVTLEIKGHRVNARAETAAPADRVRLWARLVELSPQYATYQQKTSREIPVIILHPEN